MGATTLTEPREPTTTAASSEQRARQVVRERSAGRCELDVRNVCTGRATSWSHRQSRARRGLWTPANGIDACGSGTTGCHGWVENHPTWAEAAGLSLPSWVTDPERVPAYVSWHGLARAWWHLNLDGTLTPCGELERPPWGHSADHALECPGTCR